MHDFIKKWRHMLAYKKLDKKKKETKLSFYYIITYARIGWESGWGCPRVCKVWHAFFAANQQQESQWRKTTQITSVKWVELIVTSLCIIIIVPDSTSPRKEFEKLEEHELALKVTYNQFRSHSTHLRSLRHPKLTEDDDRLSFTGILLHWASSWPRPESK